MRDFFKSVVAGWPVLAALSGIAAGVFGISYLIANGYWAILGGLYAAVVAVVIVLGMYCVGSSRRYG